MATFRTDPDAPGRLFPSRVWDTGWRLSLQADAGGYCCRPRARLDRLEDYTAVEAQITGPFPEPVDPHTLDLPRHVLDKFSELSPESGISMGVYLTWDDIDALHGAIDRAGSNPNAGIPRGEIGWRGRAVWHGTDAASARDILENGIDMSRSEKGYFGQGFHVADTPDLARSNYAEFSGDDAGGAVISGRIADDARILDLRNARDANIWSDSGLAGRVSEDGFARLARRAGIDGLYDRSVGGVVIYNPGALENLGLADPGPRGDGPTDGTEMTP